ncbi:ABC transporter permease subunit [Paracoccus sp. S-4012]|uniref:ABC transporter permease n=1 Tax=Paracoccus sp. S-4012 TaxID=2665648 RepID=UPI0012B11A6C|nr:ABC transporter permease subunit [Paracoccus sp. S-4012]MRX51440.1 ABC transporter permease subunit [Paracoccus sp. S-4012]
MSKLKPSRDTLISGIVRQIVFPALVILACWQLLSSVIGVSPLILPPPSAIYRAFFLEGRFGAHLPLIGVTVLRVAVAFSAAMVVGTLIGLLIGRSPVVRSAVYPIVKLLFPVPKVAFIPALFLILGRGNPSIIGLGFIEAVFPVIVATAERVLRTEKELVWSARSLGVSRGAELLVVYLPNALPAILAAGRFALLGAIIGVFFGEVLTTAGNGLGGALINSYNLFDIHGLYMALILVCLGAVVSDFVYTRFRDRQLRWSAEGSR